MSIEINDYLSGSTATLTHAGITIASHDARGEFTDVAPTKCDLVTVSLASSALTVENTDDGDDNTNEVFKLKNCLSTADYDDDTNQDVQNWDLGTISWPHLVRLSETGSEDGGYYSLLNYDETDWTVYHSPGITDGTEMDIHTTDATMQLVFDDVTTGTHYDDTSSDTAITIETSTIGDTSFTLDDDASCEYGASTLSNCLQKGDVIMLAASDRGVVSAVSGEFYTITRVWTKQSSSADTVTYHVSVDHALNNDFDDGFVYVLETGDETFEYVSECSNRGLCNGEEGQCECFKGYTNDNCDTQSAIAV